MKLLTTAALLSGTAGLMYQTLWARAMAQVLGGTAEGSAMTVGAFMAGMTLGAAATSSAVARRTDPFRLYAAIEVAIAIGAVGVGLFLQNSGDLVGAWVGHGAFATDMAVAMLLVGAPAAPIGAALPVLMRGAWPEAGDEGVANKLYALNVLGSAVGVVLVGFFAIRTLGVEGSYALAASLNVMAALAALAAARRCTAAATTTDTSAQTTARRETALLAMAFLSGCAVFLVEVLFTHLAQFMVGSRTYAISAMLLTVLLALGASARVVERLLPTIRRTKPTSVVTLAFAACAAGTSGSLFLADWLTRIQPGMETAWNLEGNSLVLVRLALAATVVLPALLPLGALFPLCLALSKRVSESAGGRAGGLLAVNTAGAVTGALLAAYWAIDALGLWGAYALVAALTAVAAIGLGMKTIENSKPGVPTAIVGIVCCGSLLLWTPSSPPPASAKGDRVYAAESAQGIVQVYERETDETGACSSDRRCLWMYSGRKSVLWTTGADMTVYAQKAQAHLGAAHARKIDDVLVVGAGVGITAAEIASYPEVERVDVVEIDPNVLDASHLFESVNGSYLSNPKVTAHMADGRHFLAAADREWDMITVNPTQPTLPGQSRLYHEEFYEIAAKRLKPDGVLVAQVMRPVTASAAATLKREFPHVRAIRSYPEAWVLAASRRPLEGRHANRVRKAAADDNWIGSESSIDAGTLFATAPRLAEAIPESETAAPLTDDWPKAEFMVYEKGVGAFVAPD